jgi:hypothetical protein
MPVSRKHNLDQLKRLRKQTRGVDIGDRVSKAEAGFANCIHMDNPIDRHVDTYEEHATIDIPNPPEKHLERIKSFEDFENNELNEDVSVFSPGEHANDTVQDIVRDLPNIRNWDYNKNGYTGNVRERDITAGRQINIEGVRGYINHIKGNKVYVDSIDEPGVIKELSIKDAVKGFSNESPVMVGKEKNEMPYKK